MSNYQQLFNEVARLTEEQKVVRSALEDMVKPVCEAAVEEFNNTHQIQIRLNTDHRSSPVMYTERHIGLRLKVFTADGHEFDDDFSGTSEVEDMLGKPLREILTRMFQEAGIELGISQVIVPPRYYVK